ncbi:MAG: hypothetical protein LUH43_03585 [Clostridia bacterium]|nr:hypothetical protein [Clostridia bacterium]
MTESTELEGKPTECGSDVVNAQIKEYESTPAELTLINEIESEGISPDRAVSDNAQGESADGSSTDILPATVPLICLFSGVAVALALFNSDITALDYLLSVLASAFADKITSAVGFADAAIISASRLPFIFASALLIFLLSTSVFANHFISAFSFLRGFLAGAALSSYIILWRSGADTAVFALQLTLFFTSLAATVIKIILAASAGRLPTPKKSARLSLFLAIALGAECAVYAVVIALFAYVSR